MTPEEKVAMLKKAGVWDVIGFPSCIDKLFYLVAAHEREKQAEQEPFDMDDHPPHRLCECRKCMEYFTPLPDCDAFAASGKPIAEQPVSQEYQDHLVNQSFDWAAMAAKHQLMEGYRIGLAEMREKCAKVCKERSHRSDDMGAICAAAIRAIKFEGDTGFRPVSEMIAEHKQDPKKAAAIEKAKMRKAEQKPVAIGSEWKPCMKLPVVVHVREQREGESHVSTREGITPVRPDDLIMRGVAGEEYPIGRELFNKTYTFDTAAPVRIKDLTDDEIFNLNECESSADIAFARAVIAAHKEKNHG